MRGSARVFLGELVDVATGKLRPLGVYSWVVEPLDDDKFKLSIKHISGLVASMPEKFETLSRAECQNLNIQCAGSDLDAYTLLGGLQLKLCTRFAANEGPNAEAIKNTRGVHFRDTAAALLAAKQKEKGKGLEALDSERHIGLEIAAQTAVAEADSERKSEQCKNMQLKRKTPPGAPLRTKVVKVAL